MLLIDVVVDAGILFYFIMILRYVRDCFMLYFIDVRFGTDVCLWTYFGNSGDHFGLMLDTFRPPGDSF